MSFFENCSLLASLLGLEALLLLLAFGSASDDCLVASSVHNLDSLASGAIVSCLLSVGTTADDDDDDEVGDDDADC